MSSESGSSVQFKHARVSLGDYDDFSYDKHQTGEAHPVHQGVIEVAPLTTANSSSAKRMTAWKIKRDGSAPPSPLSAENAGSNYNWNAKAGQ